MKVALITGGSRGIGKAIVEKFKAEHWHVATCSRDLQHLHESKADFKFQCDVSQVDQVKAGIVGTLSKFGQIDVLINNAGLSGSNPLEPNSNEDQWHQLLDVNLNGVYHFCKYTMPHLPHGSGRIINISSILGLKGVPDASAYCSAKHGVIGLTRSLAHLLAPRRITVNAICPGWTRSEMAVARMQEIGITEKTIQSQVPLGRMIEAEEVADLVFYLSTSLGAQMITGQALSIDGGMTP